MNKEPDMDISSRQAPLAAAAAASGPTRIVGRAKFSAVGPGPQIMAADTLEGNRVLNPQGEHLGSVQHIMIDVPQGRVAYAVLSFGGVLGMGDKLFALPWSALVLDTDHKCFVLDIPKEHLRQAGGFDKNDWPGMADKRWAEELYDYYDQRPYW
ncbi:PRC-barrel domain protein [Bordetella bronchiseptica MBORD762]|nr:PRC-barrel domain protein [Bordetella bronchiseptica MBORD698]KDD10411.1 PRC-barrel domain protein [Bordetella bronchiseptica MBORD681]KDD92391.1 PRC-barrel domain protein [Bordetella bronchiseptica MBORD762]